MPFNDGSIQGVFSEHCLEHYPLPAALLLLREIRRVLAPLGLVRIIVPDGELYLRTYTQCLGGERTVRFPYQECDTNEGIWMPMLSVNRVFYQDRESLFGHRTVFDFDLLKTVLHVSGFRHVKRQSVSAG